MKVGVPQGLCMQQTKVLCIYELITPHYIDYDEVL